MEKRLHCDEGEGEASDPWPLPYPLSVRPAKGEALVQRPHQDPFLFPVTSGPTGQEFIFNPTRTVR